MTATADITPVPRPGSMLFRRRRVSRHHHYLICRTCGLGHEITSPAFEQQIAQLAANITRTETEHTAHKAARRARPPADVRIVALPQAQSLRVIRSLSDWTCCPCRFGGPGIRSSQLSGAAPVSQWCVHLAG